MSNLITDMSLRFDNEAGRFDLQLLGDGSGGLDTDHGLETAVTASLFTDQRARDDDELPDGKDRRGFWGDTWPTISGMKVGSRFWLLNRAIITAETVARVREYGTEALQWIVDQGFASSAVFEAIRDRDAGRWVISGRAVIERPNKPVFERRYSDIWKWMDNNS